MGRVHILSERPDGAAATEALDAALAAAHELGMRPLAANTQHRLGEVCSQVGKRGRAREYLTAALNMYRELDMQLWVPEASAQLERLG